MGKTTTVKIAGPAGTGIKTSGQLLAKILLDQNFYTHDYTEYPSLIRGGHNTHQVSFSINEVFGPYFNIDLLFSLKPDHWQQHQDEFTKKSLIFSDQKTNKKLKTGKFISFPLGQLTKKAGNPITANIICLGIAAFLLDLDRKKTFKTIDQFFKDRAKDNLTAFKIGFDYAQKNYQDRKLKIAKPVAKIEKSLLDGNESFGWGFLKGKGDFYAAYPMTPSTGTLHFLAQKQKEYNIKVVHPEDEIAVANMGAGAAFAGSRVAVGTSGGGFALMNETISFCGVTEIGMVFYLVSRPGPATGMPTWTAQADLLHSIFSGHGEFPKVVLAPGDQQESVEFGWKSLNLAENLQTPIIVLSDKFLGESIKTIDDPEKIKVKIDRGKLIESNVPKNFARYNWQPLCGRSLRTIPRVSNGEFLANSYEHDQKGISTEDKKTATKMIEKRSRKIKTALKITPKPTLYGSKNPKKLIIGWGSTKGPILEAMKLLDNKDLGFLQIKTLWPLHPEIESIVKKASKVLIVENNQTSQLTVLLKTLFNFIPDEKILKFDGRPFFPEKLCEQFRKI